VIRWLFGVLVAVAALLATFALSQSASAVSTSWFGTVTNVVDGDTIDIDWDAGDEHPDGLTRIRIAGLDSNETAANECFADAAKVVLSSILPVGTHIRLEAQSMASESENRPIRHVFKGANYDENVAFPAIDQGLALPISFQAEPDYQEQYFGRGETAKAADIGMWAEHACGVPSNTGDVAIQVNYNAAGNDNTNLNDEYIEIRNLSASTISLNNWTLRSSARLNGGTIQFPAGQSIAPGGKLTVRSGSGTNSSTNMYLGFSEAWLSNTSDVVYLRDELLNMRGSQFWPCTVSCEPAEAIVVDTVHYDAPGNDLTNPNGEWLRVRNAGATVVELDGWRVRSAGSDFVFPSSASLDPGGSYTINVGSGTNTSATLYWGNSAGILPNSNGDRTVRVTAPSGIEVDCYAWGASVCIDEHPAGAIRFFANFDATGNDFTNPNGEWVALWNTSDSSINIGGYTVTNDGDSYTFDGDVILTPNRNIRLFVGSGSDNTYRKYWGLTEGILRNTGDEVDLFDPDGSLLLRHEWPCASQCQSAAIGFEIDRVNWHAPGVSSSDPAIEWIRITNNSQVFQNFRGWKIRARGYQLAAVSSRWVAPGDSIIVHINSGSNTSSDLYWNKTSPILSDSGFRTVELLSPDRSVVSCHGWGSNSCASQSLGAGLVVTANYNATGTDSSNPNGEWINIRNVSSSLLDLGGLYVYTDGTSYDIPAGTSIAPGQRLRIRFGAGSDTATELFAGGVLNPLSNTSDDVYLRSKSTDWDVASFSYPCVEDCAHDLFEFGVVNPDAVGSDATNPNGEWIEIRNAGTKPASLADWRLQYKTGTFLDFEGPVVIAPGATVTVFMGTGSDTTSEVYWGFASGYLSNASGSLTLWSPQRDVVDTYSW